MVFIVNCVWAVVWNAVELLHETGWSPFQLLRDLKQDSQFRLQLNLGAASGWLQLLSYFKPTQVMDVHAAVRTGTEPSLLKAALRRTARCLMDGQAGAPLSREAEYYSLLTFFWGYYNPYYTFYWTLYTGHAGLFREQMPRHAVQLLFPGILYPRCCHACPG